jgi:hypothetical protein
MTKSQNNQAFNTASKQQATTGANAQSSYNAAQGDITQFGDALSKYAAENPYGTGGAFQVAQNQQGADVANAGAGQLREALTSEAVRSGMNPNAGIAAGEQVAEANARNQMGINAGATEARLGAGAAYGGNVLNETAKPEEMEADLMKPELSASTGALGQETDLSKQPSFWQELGQGAINAGTAYAGGLAKACWIAAYLFGGWDDRRVNLIRFWLMQSFSRKWYGALLYRLYQRLGERAAAKWMPASPAFAALMYWIFSHALMAAEAWLATSEGSRAWENYAQYLERQGDQIRMRSLGVL